ncbi:MAG: L,D-transpeptidase family protein [Chloroflexi bacterium]|nr:L,D-transpeptidase family protein [Chloroflexota bacterium]
MQSLPNPQLAYAPKNRSVNVNVLAAGVVVVLLALIFWCVFFFVWGYLHVSQRILPGVTAAGVQVGGMTVSEAEAAIHEKWNMGHQVLIGSEDQWWRTPSLSLGIYVDSVKIAQDSFEMGRGSGALAEWVAILLGGQPMGGPEILFNEEMARNTLAQISQLVYAAPQPNEIVYENGQWIAKDGLNGKALDVESAVLILRSDPERVLSQGQLELTYVPIAVETVNAGILQELNQIGNRPLTASLYDPFSGDIHDFEIGMDRVGPYLGWDAQAQRMTLDAAELVDEVTTFLETSQSVKVRMDEDLSAVEEAWKSGRGLEFSVVDVPRPYQVESGDTLLKISQKFRLPYWYILQANPGIQPNSLIAGAEITIPSRNEMLPLPYARNKRIVISIPEQRMRVYENGAQVHEFIVSTGIATSPTFPGVYQVRTHELSAYASNWDLTMPHFLGIYEAWPGFMNGIHGLPTLSNGRILWGNVLGGPASYGCIILSLENAELLYDWAEDGVVVEIIG